MAGKNCSNAAEVQNADSDEFRKRLTSVFSECHRVLKDEGILAFSFHHSRPEGWGAIYEAVAKADFRIVAAYPVHSEMKVSMPLSAAKEPISIDVILICRKNGFIGSMYFHNHVESQIKNLQRNGITLTKADCFVIKAAALLVTHSKEPKNYDEMNVILNNIYK